MLRKPSEDRGEDWSDAATSPWTPGIDGSYPEEVRKDPPLELSEGAWPCQHLDFGLLALALEENNCFWSPSVCSNLLWQP